MPKNFPFYRWFPADAATDLKFASLNMEERGLFHSCLDLSWFNDGIPSDPEDIRRGVRATKEEFDRSWPAVEGMFPLTEGVRRNKRLESERLMASAKRDQSTQAAHARHESGRTADAQRTHSGRTADGMPRALARNARLTSDFSNGLSSSNNQKDKDGFHDNLTTTEYATERDELVATIERSTGRRPENKFVLQITETLEIQGATLRAYLDDIEPRLKRLRKAAGEGFFLSQARAWGTTSASPAKTPETKTEAAKRNGHCPDCDNVGRVNGAYCDCRMGKDLARAEAPGRKPDVQ